jgi:hypothetical protein
VDHRHNHADHHHLADIVDPMNVYCVYTDGGTLPAKTFQIWIFDQAWDRVNAPSYYCNPNWSWIVKEEGFYFLNHNSSSCNDYVLYTSWWDHVFTLNNKNNPIIYNLVIVFSHQIIKIIQ